MSRLQHPAGQNVLRRDRRKRLAVGPGVAQTGPLPGAYPRSALPVLERRLASGDLALRAAVDELRLPVIELDPAELVNVNERADLDALERGAAR